MKKAEIFYDYIIVMRDDTEWLAPMDFNALIQQKHIYIPSCNARNPTMHPLKIVCQRKAADFFGSYFATSFPPELAQKHCSQRLPRDITYDEVNRLEGSSWLQ